MTKAWKRSLGVAGAMIGLTCSAVRADPSGRAQQSNAGDGLLVSTRFDQGPLDRPYAFVVTGDKGAKCRVELAGEGTIDSYMGRPTPALKWTVETSGVEGAKAVARVMTVPLAVSNAEAELARLTFGFDLWVSQLRPVRVRVTSLRDDGSDGGSVVRTVVPPVAGAFYRFTPDLGTFKADSGTFDPRATKVRFGFELAGDDLPLAPQVVVKIDNLSYAAPAYYIAPTGSDAADGRSPGTAFATPQHALDVARPGDVILAMDGTYVSKDRQTLLGVNKAGEPDRWIVLRAAPGQKPVFRGTGWDVVGIGTHGAYVEFNGLTVRGYADEISKADAQADEQLRTKDGKRYTGDPRMNTNGFAADGRQGQENGGHPHHLRFINNTVLYQPGAGIGLCAPDHVTIEGNVAEDNCHTMRYASSGISILSAWNFDADDGYKLFVVGNRSARNQCFVRWSEIGRISDGNGIIIDQFIQFDYKTNKPGERPYTGRTLVQNNLVFGNGGSGIHAFASNHVDIVNNTAFHNAQSPELSWRQIFAGSKCRDIHIVNNILCAQSGKPVYTAMGDSKDVFYDHNLIFGEGNNNGAEGGGLGTSKGGKQAVVTNAVEGAPQFVVPSLGSEGDFHLGSGSPAAGAGTWNSQGVPIVDIDGSSRVNGGVVDLGALAVTRH